MARIQSRYGTYFREEKNPKKTKTKNQIKSKYHNKQCRYKTNEEIPDLRLSSNLVACTLSKKLEFEAPARPHWRTANLSFLGLVQLCLACWQICVMAPAPSFPLHSGLRHTVKAAVPLHHHPPKMPSVSKVCYNFAA